MKVELSHYNPEWANIFEKEKENLKKALGNKAVQIEHVGSTSVTGLGAKPVIDILLGVYKLLDAEEFIPRMQKLGYEYITKYEDVMPERRYFVKRETANTLRFNVHSYELANANWCRHMMFRDYLRSNETVKKEYYQLKKELSSKDWSESNDYADAKTSFIRKAEQDALSLFTFITEKAECKALYEMYDRISSKEKKSFGITGKRFGTATAVRTDIFPGFSHNRVPGLGLSSGLDEKTLVEIKKFYEGSKNIYALQLVPHILNNETKELLERQGFVFKKNWVRFYRDVSPIENVRTDLVVKQVGKQYADTYGEILTRIFDFPRELACTMTSVMEAENWKHFMAFDGEKPVTTGSVYSGSDTAWIGFAATEPTHRGRGGQAAVLAARINAAREHGCKWISVETAEETAEHDAPSYRNMLRYGFRLLYKRPNYVFTP